MGVPALRPLVTGFVLDRDVNVPPNQPPHQTATRRWACNPASIGRRGLLIVGAMMAVRARFARAGVFAFGAVGWVWLFFGPIAAGHHLIICGVLAPWALDAGSPNSSSGLWHLYAVRGSPTRLAISFVLSVVAIRLWWLLLYWDDRKRHPRGTPCGKSEIANQKSQIPAPGVDSSETAS